jgi:ribulose-phosphate 3-epimerase
VTFVVLLLLLYTTIVSDVGLSGNNCVQERVTGAIDKTFNTLLNLTQYMDKTILPSIIAPSQVELDERIAKVKDHFSVLHLDIMDGRFVANESLNFAFTLPQEISFEAHLMVENPEKWVEKHIELVDTVFVHLTSVTTPNGLIQFVHEKEKKIGFVLSPDDVLDDLHPFIDLLDYVLFMAVVPGQYGAPFIPAVIKNIEALYQHNPALLIQVDGAVNPTTIGELSAAGASRFVVGSYLQESSSVQNALSRLRSILSKKTKP